MATETIVMASEVEIKQAMGVLGLGGFTDTLLSEIELDRELAISIAQANRGELLTREELKKRIDEKFANGYFTKENAQKRIKEKYGK
jgi:hypothetical protein